MDWNHDLSCIPTDPDEGLFIRVAGQAHPRWVYWDEDSQKFYTDDDDDAGVSRDQILAWATME